MIQDKKKRIRKEKEETKIKAQQEKEAEAEKKLKEAREVDPKLTLSDADLDNEEDLMTASIIFESEDEDILFWIEFLSKNLKLWLVNRGHKTTICLIKLVGSFKDMSS